MDTTPTCSPDQGPPITADRLSGSWRRSDRLAAGLALLAHAAAFFPAWEYLVRAWYGSEDFSHGFIIVPVAAWIVWQRRALLGQLRISTSWFGLAIVMAAAAVYLGALLTGIWTVASLSLIAALAGGLLFAAGMPALRACAFPLFLLLFMVPVPSQVYAMATAPLQLLVSKIAALAVAAAGVPLWREGNILHLPERSFQVIQACSGLRSVLVLMTIGLLLGYFTLRSNTLRGLLFAAGLPVAVLVNIVRVVAMILAFQFLGLDLTQGDVHTWFGLGIFALALVLLFSLRGALAKWERASAVG